MSKSQKWKNLYSNVYYDKNTEEIFDKIVKYLDNHKRRDNYQYFVIDDYFKKILEKISQRK